MDVINTDPSYEEVWDDSLLIDSWNQALEEYKKYHSIHAKGGSIRDLEQEGLGSSKENDNAVHNNKQESPVDEQQLNETKPEGQQPNIAARNNVSSDANHGPHLGNANATPVGFPPQAILGSVRDENLKKLLMSWYYAGYYTGLFEGQQQAQQPQEAQQQP